MKGIQVFNDSHNPYYPWKQQQPTASELYSQTMQYRVLPIFSSVTPSPKHLSVDSAFYKQERHYTCHPSDNFPRECKDVVSSFWRYLVHYRLLLMCVIGVCKTVLDIVLGRQALAQSEGPSTQTWLSFSLKKEWLKWCFCDAQFHSGYFMNPQYSNFSYRGIYIIIAAMFGVGEKVTEWMTNILFMSHHVLTL